MRASRLLSILILLQLRTRLTAEELADEFEVSVRTIYRDIDALSAAIGEVLSDPARALLVADAGYRRYAEHCTPSHMVQPIERELCALL